MPLVTATRIILASRSPRRVALLREAGYDVTVIEPPYVDPPTPSQTADPTMLAMELSELKGRSVLAAGDAALEHADVIIAADTLVVTPAPESTVLGQPADRREAADMLAMLLGREHQVITGVALARRKREQWQWSRLVDTASVTMPAQDSAVIEAYLDGHQWRGKAGGYNLAELAHWGIVVTGDPTTVIGLPMQALAEMLPPPHRNCNHNRHHDHDQCSAPAGNG